MGARDWKSIVIEAEGPDFEENAYTYVAYEFGGGRRLRHCLIREFKKREIPGEAYDWVD